MKIKSIKTEILLNFIYSILYSITITLGFLFFSLFILYLINADYYFKFINLYNTSSQFISCFSFILFIIFIAIMSFVFFKKMDNITNYIREISNTVNKVSKGNRNVSIPINYSNELGSLAIDINNMISSINSFIEKEKQWEENKNNLITNISHDLRTPLTSVIGFIEIIKSKNFNNEDEFNHYCTIAFNKANELKDSLNELFEFTKLANGDIKLNIISFCLNELIEQTIIGFIPLFKKNNMEYKIICEKPKILIKGDPILLKRVFENIVSNAIKYGSSGRLLIINVDEENNKKIIKFTNYGEMIKEKDLKNLFLRLYRGDKKSNKKEGTGLGLAISKTIIDLHCGEISASSSEEKTEFKIVLQ